MGNAIKVLPAIKETPDEYSDIEAELIELLKKELYVPLVRALGGERTLKNSKEDLIAAIQSGKIIYRLGKFSGKFTSVISLELKKLGAIWDRVTKSYSVPSSKVPIEIRQASKLSAASFEAKLSKAMESIPLPEEIADKVNLTKLMDKALFKLDAKIAENLKAVVLTPKFTAEQRARIAAEYTQNMQLDIKEWTQKETVKLRKSMQERLLKGGRYEEMFDEIQKSYGVARSKAKFLARQETGLFMTKVKQTRYQDAGVDEYIWGCVSGTKDHPVRPDHKKNEGKIFKWSNPPTVDAAGNRKNPGQDYNCRCFAKPVVRF